MRNLTAQEVIAVRRLHRERTAQSPKRSIHTTRTLAKVFKVSSATISRWLTSQHLPGERPRVPPKPVTDGMDARRAIVKTLAGKTKVNNNRVNPEFGSLAAIRAELHSTYGIDVTRQTVHTDLRALGFVCRIRPRVPCTDLADYRRRLNFVRSIIARSISGRDIIFSDEKLFTTNDFCGRSMWIAPGTTPLARENARWPVKLMVWGAIGHNFRALQVLRNRHNDREGFRLTTDTYIRRVLQIHIPAIRATGKSFMQDGAACHTAGRTLNYLDKKGISLLGDWPARSPDLNPIERLWAILQVRVSRHHPRTIDDLHAAVVLEWNRLNTTTINGVVDDFDVRVQTVQAVNGGWPTNAHR